MFEYLEKLRNKSVKEKKRILWASTVSLWLVILAVWYLTSQISYFKNKPEAKPYVDNAPWQQLKNMTADAFSAFENQFSTIKKSAGF